MKGPPGSNPPGVAAMEHDAGLRLPRLKGELFEVRPLRELSMEASRYGLARRYGASAEHRTIVPGGLHRVPVVPASLLRAKEAQRAPVDVSSEDRGYDIESRNPATGRLRFIEAKGRRADTRTVSTTHNEMLTAFNAADSLTLAVSLVEGEFVRHPLHLPESGAGLRSGAWIRRGVPDHRRGCNQACGQKWMRGRIGSGVAVGEIWTRPRSLTAEK